MKKKLPMYLYIIIGIILLALGVAYYLWSSPTITP